MLHRAAQHLAAKRKAHLSTLVEYRRPSQSDAPPLIETELLAMRGRTAADIDRGDGFVETTTLFDWIITPDDLRLDSDPVKPEPGDVIVENAADRIVTYEVLPMGNEPCWRYCDGHRASIRIHTKRIREEAY